GHVCFFSNVATNVIVDINGWHATGTGFNPVGPTRAIDTRAAEPSLIPVEKAKVGGSHVLDVRLTGLAGLIPSAGVAAISMNVTVDGPQGPGFVTVFPCSQPDVSSVN